MAVQWSTLPGDILTALAKILNSDIDFLRLRSVCSSWRSSISPLRKPLSFPTELPPLHSPFDCNGANCSCYFLLYQSTVYRLSPPDYGACSGNSSDGWLFKVTERNPNSFSLLAPLSTHKINYSPDTVSKHLNLLDFRISEICKGYNLHFVYPDRYSECQPCIIRKVIVLWNYVVGCDFVVLILLCTGGMEYLKVGDAKWTPFDSKGYDVCDMIIFEGKCYAIDRTGVLVSIDSKLNVTVVVSSADRFPFQQNYLVEYKSDLYMVCKIPIPTPPAIYAEEGSVVETSTIDIPFKLRIFKKKCDGWNSMGDLGDMVLFLANDLSFGVSALDFGGLKGNCVFLADLNFYKDGRGSVYGDHIGVYDLDVPSVKGLAVAQDFEKVFWPPPTWLPCPSSSDGDSR